MQSTVKFFELPAQSEIGGLCAKKVAVKMSTKDAAAMENDAGCFAEMVAALMALPTEGIDQSLPGLGWVSAEGGVTGEGGKEWVPLIDLSNSDGTGQTMVQLLMRETNNKNGEHAFFKLKINENAGRNPATLAVDDPELFAADGLSDAQSAVLDPDAPLDTGTAEETFAPDLGDPIRFSAKGEPAVQVEPPVLKTEPLMQKRPGDAAEDPSIKIDPKKDSADLQSPSDMVKSDAPSISETMRTALSRQDQKEAHSTAAPKGASQATGDPVNQEARNIGADAQSMKGQEQHRRGTEGSERHHLSADADAIMNASSESSGGPASTQTDTTSNSGVTNFQNHLRNITAAHADAAKTATDFPADSQEMQTDVIRQIVQRMTLRADGRTSQMQVQLKPEFLGNMHMDIMTENHQVMIRMTAENSKVKEIIEQNIHLLRAEMQQHGLQVHKIDVYVSQDQDSWKNGQQQTAFQQAHDRNRQQGRYQGGRRESAAENPWTSVATVKKEVGGKTSEVDFFA